jgi:hypothetical protein
MVALAEGEEGHLHLVEHVDQHHAEDFRVERDGPRQVPHTQNDVADSLQRRRDGSSPPRTLSGITDCLPGPARNSFATGGLVTPGRNGDHVK